MKANMNKSIPTKVTGEKKCKHQFVSYKDTEYAHPFVCILCGEKRLVGHEGIIFIYNTKEDIWEHYDR